MDLWRKFLFPDLRRRWFWLRLGIVAAVAYSFFGYVCIPTWIHGKSMEPTYHDGTVNFCWCPRFWFREPQPGAVVIVRLGGRSAMYLKRLVAVAGDTVEFRNGRLLVNGKEQVEPYVQGPCDWNLEPRTVKPGYVYVVGDNRSVPLEQHRFGQTERRRIMGGPLW